MLTSSEVKVQQQRLSVVDGGVLEQVHVCLGQGAAGSEVELDAFVAQRPEVGLVLEASVRVHELPAEVVGLSDALVNFP